MRLCAGVHEEIKITLPLMNACYRAVQNDLPSHRYQKSNIKTYKSLILPVVLYCCKTWVLTLWDQHRLKVFEKRCLGEYFDLQGIEW